MLAKKKKVAFPIFFHRFLLLSVTALIWQSSCGLNLCYEILTGHNTSMHAYVMILSSACELSFYDFWVLMLKIIEVSSECSMLSLIRCLSSLQFKIARYNHSCVCISCRWMRMARSQDCAESVPTRNVGQVSSWPRTLTVTTAANVAWHTFLTSQKKKPKLLEK